MIDSLSYEFLAHHFFWKLEFVFFLQNNFATKLIGTNTVYL